MSARASRPAVMTDVAQLAGVSHQTVSRVINGHPHVRVETRERVLEAMEKLGYRRNLTARALATHASKPSWASCRLASSKPPRKPPDWRFHSRA